jgi:tryptophan-rich sensory protein
VGLVGWLLLCFLPAGLSVLARPDAWFNTLHKPSWNPPPWIFGPVWTVLYGLMGVSAWRVWMHGGFRRQRSTLMVFLTQLGLNAMWTPVFFGLHLLGLSVLVIVTLWVAIAVTALKFRTVSPLAAALLLPYLAWVSFAMILNASIWRMNS